MSIVNEIKLVMTCSAHPEQYDAFYNDKQVSYLRLRHGCFSVDYPDVGGEEIYYSEDMDGDGSFEDHERDSFLNKAKEAIAKKIREDELEVG